MINIFNVEGTPRLPLHISVFQKESHDINSVSGSLKSLKKENSTLFIAG